jgi:hypothetical protein
MQGVWVEMLWTSGLLLLSLRKRGNATLWFDANYQPANDGFEESRCVIVLVK